MSTKTRFPQYRSQAELDRMLRRLAAVTRARAAQGASLFGKADDRLSRAASAMARIAREYDEAEDRDAAFDAGEFSGPALARMREDEIDETLREHGFDDYGAFEDAFASRCRVRGSR